MGKPFYKFSLTFLYSFLE